MGKKVLTVIIMAAVAFLVFALSVIFLIFGKELAARYDVIGIRIATLFVAFASFCTTGLFSYFIYSHNKTVRETNIDANKRAEMFRTMQFASANYSIVEFTDNITIQRESARYINKYILNNSFKFHLIEDSINCDDICGNISDYTFLTLTIPYHVAEGKLVASISIERIKFEREEKSFRFVKPKSEDESYAFLLYNDQIKNSNAIINLVVKKDSDFFQFGKINYFSKIKVNVKTISLLGVEVKGIAELYFSNPESKEQDGGNTYKINSSNFIITELPKLNDMSYYVNNLNI